MGREADNNEAMRMAQLERTMGPTRPFEHYHHPKPSVDGSEPKAAGCPKCGGKQFLTQFCIGSSKLTDGGTGGGCPYFGEHLHRACATCSYGWTEKCADAEPEASPLA